MRYNPFMPRPAWRFALCCLFVGATSSAPAGAQNSLVEVDKFSPENSGYLGAAFGGDVAISGDTAVIGAARRDFGFPNHDGQVYVFTRPSNDAPWEFLQTLISTGALAGECFGHSVAIEGDLIVVGSGAPDANDSGAAYVYRRTTERFDFEARLTEPQIPPQAGDYGQAVDVSGGTIAISDPLRHGNGRVFVYTRIAGTWTRQATLGPAAGASGKFGVALSLFGDQLAAGTQRRNLGQGGDVSVFLHSGGTWLLQNVLIPSTAPYGRFADDDYGVALDLLDTTLIVGAPEDRDPAQPSSARRGAAFVYTRTGQTWSQTARIDPLLAEPGARFGSSVGLVDGSFAAIGADGQNASSVSLTRGKVSTFRRSGSSWLQEHVLTASDADDHDRLGHALAVALHGSTATLIAGADGWFGNSGKVCSFRVDGASWRETDLLREPVQHYDRFGAAVAIDGELAVVGAPYENTERGRDAGAAYVYRRTGASWSRVGRLSPSVLTEYDHFGAAVAISGTTIAVAASFDDHTAGVDAGSVLVFDLQGTSWALVQTVRASDAAAGDQFGHALALRSSTLLVGAPLDDNAAGVNAGSAYLFTRSGSVWAQGAKLVSTDLAAGDEFGAAVAIVAQMRVLVGAPHDDPLGVSSGSAYVFDRTLIIGGSVWSQRTKLVPPGGSAGDRFGRALRATGSLVAVGAPFDDVPGAQDVGSVHLYRVTGAGPGTLGNVFTALQQILPANPAPGDGFGSALALDGDELVVGAPGDDTPGGLDAGSVVHLRPQASGLWGTTGLTTASDGRTQAQLGYSVAVSGSWVIAGAHLDTNEAGGNAGAAYVLDAWRGDGVGTSYCAAVSNSTGLTALISGLGSPYLTSNDLRLRASRLPAQSTAFFLVSRTSGYVLHPGGSYGSLCLAGSIGRFVGPGQVQSSGATGVVELTLDLAALPQPSGAVAGRVGEVWHFQTWYRDSVAGSATSNFTDGLAVVLH